MVFVTMWSSLINAQADAIKETLFRVLVDPEKYDGKEISTIGYLHLEFEGNCLYLHQEDFEMKIIGNSIWVDLEKERDEKYSQLNDKYVIIVGTFDSHKKGHKGASSGTITKITRLEIWSEPMLPVKSQAE